MWWASARASQQVWGGPRTRPLNPILVLSSHLALSFIVRWGWVCTVCCGGALLGLGFWRESQWVELPGGACGGDSGEWAGRQPRAPGLGTGAQLSRACGLVRLGQVSSHGGTAPQATLKTPGCPSWSWEGKSQGFVETREGQHPRRPGAPRVSKTELW